MKKYTLCAVLGLALTLAFAPSARAEHTRVTNPSAIGVEVLGRGLAYSIFFDRVLSDELVAGIGIGSVGLEAGTSALGTRNTATAIPAYFNYYFAKEQGSLFFTGGVSILTGDFSGNRTKLGALDIGESIIPTVGVGYENRSDAGYVFRLAGYALIGDNVRPWGGFSLGYSF